MKINFILIILFLNFLSYGQKSTEYDYGIPLPPESYQFKKRLLNNVSLYTGQPSIDIPIYTINLDGMEVPISISYNTGGIKVEEDATSVGLGWNLNIGGQITRDNHGLPDERYFIKKPYYDKFGIGGLKQSELDGNNGEFTACNVEIYRSRGAFYDQAFRAGENVMTNYPPADSRPDVFFYSLLGHNGKFMFNQELKKFITFPLDDILIDYELGTRSVIPYNNYFDSFNIKLPTGYNLILGKDGRSSISYLGGEPFDQSWQLKKIKSPKNKEITYNYITARYNLYTNLGNHNYVLLNSIKDYVGSSYESNTTNNIENLISEIVFPSGRIFFEYGDRIDLQTGAKKLQGITIYNNENDVIKKITLIQTYFNSNVNLFGKDAVDQRLRLDALKFYDAKNKNIETYNFDYYLLEKIPSRYSKAQDHWGYFNGKDSNISLLPEYLLPGRNLPSNLGYDRDVDTLYTKTFSLKSIKFPEGGIKIYSYENHKALTGQTSGSLFDEITDERYDRKEASYNISGYNLNYFYPNPSEINSFNKVFYSDPFVVSELATKLRSGVSSLELKSDLPLKVPNYMNINSEFNKVEFYIEKKQVDGTFKIFKYLGTISKDESSNGITGSYFEGAGIFRFKILITQNYLLSKPSDYNFPHSTFIKIFYRDKVRDEVTVGGLRIKDIKTYTGEDLNNMKYKTYFTYLEENNITSGRVVSVPSYIENISKRQPSSVPDVPPYIYLGVRFSSKSILPLYKTSGSNVGYKKVTQIDFNYFDKSIIKEESYFSFYDPLFSELPEKVKLREFEPREWQSGKLIQKKYFKENIVIREDFYSYYGSYPEMNMGYVDEINNEMFDQNLLCSSNNFYVSKHFYPENVWYPKLLDYGLGPVAYLSYQGNKYDVVSSYMKNAGATLIPPPPSNMILPIGPVQVDVPYFKIYTGFDKLKSKTTIDYFDSKNVSQTENYYYNTTPTSLQLSSQTTTNSKGEILETKYYYAQDAIMINEPFRNELISKNIVSIPLKTEVFKGANKLSEKKTEYGSFPSEFTGYPLILPKYIYNKKGDVIPNQLEKTFSFESYDILGNIRQFKAENDIPVTIIWGYNKTQPIAKIENATYAQIATALGVTTTVLDTYNETNLTAINNLRTSLPTAMVTTYTYIPLVGVSTITDPKGDIITYSYDTFGRLEFVKDKNGNILSENQYNYKQ